MGRIEEIPEGSAPVNGSIGEPTPDMIAEALKTYAIDQQKNGNANVQVPPGMDAYKNMTSEDILKDLNKTPLFMTDLEENDDLEAFKALAYEGPPSEVAQNFKEQGNDVFKLKCWADAKEFYTKAITVLQAEERKRKEEMQLAEGGAKIEASSQEDVDAERKEIAEQKKLLEACLGNRSACHVQLKNYRSATIDCAGVLKLNPNNVKALYRSGVALLALGKIAEADDACAHGLALDESHKDLKSLAEQIIAKAKEADAKRAKEAAEKARAEKERLTLLAALRARGIKIRKTEQPPEMEDARVKLHPDPVDPTSTLAFPTVLLYPLVLQSDFVKEFYETNTIGEHLDMILGERAPWDEQGEYNPKNVECYVETMTGGLIKVGRAASLLKILSSGKVEVVDDVVRIFVVPASKAPAWIADFKLKKAAEKGAKA